MKKLRTLGIICGLLALLAWPAAAAMNQTVKVADQAGIGKYLTDGDGMTLYAFGKDSVGKSACSGSCLDNWPAFYQEKVVPPEGLQATDFGTITREDGTKQTTFRGYPLYYYKGDGAAGEAMGNGMFGMWHVVNPDHFPAM